MLGDPALALLPDPVPALGCNVPVTFREVSCSLRVVGRVMVRSDGFYLHEDWIGDLHAIMLHRGDCPHCNNGKISGDEYGLTVGTWHGPFKSQEDAAASSSALPDVNVRVMCHCVKARK